MASSAVRIGRVKLASVHLRVFVETYSWLHAHLPETMVRVLKLTIGILFVGLSKLILSYYVKRMSRITDVIANQCGNDRHEVRLRIIGFKRFVHDQYALIGKVLDLLRPLLLPYEVRLAKKAHRNLRHIMDCIAEFEGIVLAGPGDPQVIEEGALMSKTLESLQASYRVFPGYVKGFLWLVASISFGFLVIALADLTGVRIGDWHFAPALLTAASVALFGVAIFVNPGFWVGDGSSWTSKEHG